MYSITLDSCYSYYNFLGPLINYFCFHWVLTFLSQLFICPFHHSLLLCFYFSSSEFPVFYSVYGVVMISAVLTESEDLSVRVSPSCVLSCLLFVRLILSVVSSRFLQFLLSPRTFLSGFPRAAYSLVFSSSI